MGAILWAQLLGSGTRRRISVKGTFATTDRCLPRLLSFRKLSFSSLTSAYSLLCLICGWPTIV